MTRFGAAIFGCEGFRLSASEKTFFREASPFGFILFARNIDTADQVRALCQELRDSVGWHAPIFIDQEGGRVQRFRPPLAREWQPPLDDAQRFGSNAARAMQVRYQIIALELRALGLDGNCAPMLDIARPETHRFLRNRCYGETLEQVVQIGQAVAQGLRDGGVLPVIKHIPGHGLGQLDSHLELPRISAPQAELEALDFAAFKPFATEVLGMTAHLVFEDIAPEPATISPQMIGLIRNTIGFQGLLMTDDISMEALSGTVVDRAEASIRAGCDVVLHCNGDLDEMRGIADAVGLMTDPAQVRADTALASRTNPPELDIAALEAEREMLLANS